VGAFAVLSGLALAARGDGSAWYPTARLFRQRRRGDWADVIARVGQALAEQARPSRAVKVRIEIEPAELTDWLALLEAASGEPHQRRALASRLRLLARQGNAAAAMA
jgi:hypothetical protein